MAEKIDGHDESRECEGAVAATARLIIRAKAGDRTAFDQIIISHQRKIISLAWRMLGNQEDARDAAQETFMRVYKSFGRFDPAQDFNGWLYRIAVNVCRDLARKRRSNHFSLEAAVESGAIAELASPHNTESAAMLAQEQAILLRALATLPEKERAAIVLRDLEELDTEEVARILGSRPTTVRSQISAARVKIKAFRERFLKRGTVPRA
ncbi:MAG TPA: sigma-70 family RNA polymerase sigma factor [Blastocatellia bacterium]|nr:sigma-70 family RNA polymerase sigma factor [Blastocatellia bacterium]